MTMMVVVKDQRFLSFRKCVASSSTFEEDAGV
jgi:hypothetical protein